MKPTYALYNEELGYVMDCPAYSDIKQAEAACADKCRCHRVIELRPEDIKPCHPLSKFRPTDNARKCCEACMRFAGWNNDK